MEIRYSDRVREALEAPVLPRTELLYFTGGALEVPLVLPGWARNIPQLAEAIDAGHALRDAAGLPGTR